MEQSHPLTTETIVSLITPFLDATSILRLSAVVRVLRPLVAAAAAVARERAAASHAAAAASPKHGTGRRAPAAAAECLSRLTVDAPTAAVLALLTQQARLGVDFPLVLRGAAAVRACLAVAAWRSRLAVELDAADTAALVPLLRPLRRAPNLQRLALNAGLLGDAGLADLVRLLWGDQTVAQPPPRKPTRTLPQNTALHSACPQCSAPIPSYSFRPPQFQQPSQQPSFSFQSHQSYNPSTQFNASSYNNNQFPSNKVYANFQHFQGQFQPGSTQQLNYYPGQHQPCPPQHQNQNHNFQQQYQQQFQYNHQQRQHPVQYLPHNNNQVNNANGNRGRNNRNYQNNNNRNLNSKCKICNFPLPRPGQPLAALDIPPALVPPSASESFDLTTSLPDLEVPSSKAALKRQNLSVLALNDNLLTDMSLKLLSERVIPFCHSLNIVDLSGNEFTEAGMAILSANLPTTNISDLNLSFTGMTDASFQYLSQALPMTSLASLVLSDNKLTHVGMQSLGLSLRDTPRLKHLDLGSNQGIADLGAQRIVSALLEGCSLESLCLEKCNIGFKAVWPLSKTLRKSKIRVLKVSENPRIGPPGLTKLGNGLCGSLVEEFYAAGVTGKDAGCRAVADSLLGNSRVRVLDLRDNQVTNDGANALASVVGASCVQRLFLEENSITDRGIKFLASALLKSQVVELAVECNLVEDEGVLALERAFAEIRKKRTIKIRY